MSAVAQVQGMALADFVRCYAAEGPFEMAAGEKTPVTPQAIGSARVAGRLFRLLADFVTARALGEVFIEAPFVLTFPDDAQWVRGARVPDVMFVRAGRLAQLAQMHPDWETLPLLLVPDLVAEVVSPTDRFTDVHRKVESYLQDGVQRVWVVDPARRTVTVHLPGSKQQTTLGGTDHLTGGEVIPGVALPVALLFD